MIGAIHPWLFGIANSGWIEILGVHPTHTGKGVGKKLGVWLFNKFKYTLIFNYFHWVMNILIRAIHRSTILF